jgi:cell division protein FtsW
MSAAAARKTGTGIDAPAVDGLLLLLIALLLGGGLIMLSSASISLADRNTGDPFYFVERQLLAVILGIAGALVMLRIPSEHWRQLGPMTALLALVLLALVLVPGMGREVNGSVRWLRLAGFSLQVAEPARLLMLIYVAGYATRHADDLQQRAWGFFKPMLVVGAAAGLLLLQPDFGSAVVLTTICLAVLFVAGARLLWFFGVSLLVGGLAIVAALASPYRLARITGFMDPWSDPYGSGFQLTQSLIAIGSGELTGVGLGSSMQKLFYLPEAHTDFVFAVLAEEFGLLGSLALVALFAALIWRALLVAKQAALLQRMFQAYLCFGFAVWLGAQVFINIGVNMGILPTKGLTLPLVSYGRSSLIITLIALGLLLRIDYENRKPAPRKRRKATGRGRKGARA